MERLLACILALTLAVLAALTAIYTLVPMAAMGAVLLFCFLLEVVRVSAALMAWTAASWPHYLPLEWWQWASLEALLVLYVGSAFFGRWQMRRQAKQVSSEV